MIDTHCHIDDPQYQPLSDYLRVQQEGGVEAIIVPATDAASSKSVLELCKTLNSKLSTEGRNQTTSLNYQLSNNRAPLGLRTLNLKIYPAIGLHPEEVGPDWQQQLDEIESLLFSTFNLSTKQLLSAINFQLSTITAIGEIGLDYHFSTEFKLEQQEAFRRQLRWAKALDLPVIVHLRDATEDGLRILAEENIHKGVLHCFSGSNETALKAIKMGFYLGIGGVITFKNCKLKDALVGVPLERLVLETDGPYMAPVPHRGERNESRWMSYVVDVLCEVYEVGKEEVDRQTTANAKALFNLN